MLRQHSAQCGFVPKFIYNHVLVAPLAIKQQIFFPISITYQPTGKAIRVTSGFNIIVPVDL